MLREIRSNARLAYRVIGFVDDLAERKGTHVAGVPVLGGGDAIRSLVAKHRIEMVLIAIPSATGTEMTRILELCHAARCDCRTVPGLGEMIEGCGLTGQIREVAVEDLLGRTPVRLEEGLGQHTILDHAAKQAVGADDAGVVLYPSLLSQPTRSPSSFHESIRWVPETRRRFPARLLQRMLDRDWTI